MTHAADAVSNPLVKLHVTTDTTPARPPLRADGVLVGVTLAVLAWAATAAMVIAALAPLADVVR